MFITKHKTHRYIVQESFEKKAAYLSNNNFNIKIFTPNSIPIVVFVKLGSSWDQNVV